MELIPSNLCQAITGSLCKSDGYYIRRIGARLFSQRSLTGPRVPDGHLRFIFSCAQMARDGFLIADIDIRGGELIQAAQEAGITMETIQPDVQYNAQDILNIKTYYGL